MQDDIQENSWIENTNKNIADTISLYFIVIYSVENSKLLYIMPKFAYGNSGELCVTLLCHSA